ncbi:MAG: hypothetical protein ACRDMJ_19930, partial [Solirubrobacteraceae bacterium]
LHPRSDLRCGGRAAPWLAHRTSRHAGRSSRRRIRGAACSYWRVRLSATSRFGCASEVLHSFANTSPLWGGFRRVVTIHDLSYQVLPEACRR